MHRFAYRPTTVSSKLAAHLAHSRARMATTSEVAAAAGAAAAPWRELFLEHVGKMASPEFTLSTVRSISEPPGPLYSARARTCIFRGLFAALPVNPKNPAPLNPEGAYESDFLTFTTDRRMDKMAELLGADPEKEDERRRTRRGAPVEAMFWVRETSTQWRVRGRCYVLGPDLDAPDAGAAKVVEELRLGMRKEKKQQSTGSSDEEEWSFSREVTAHFGNLSPLMRGSFRNPPPGAPVAVPVEDGRLALGQRVEDVHDEAARANFRVVVVAPTEVDRADLSDPQRGRRWVYTLRDDGGTEPSVPGGVVLDGWEKVEVWP
ncbi:pyridoxamine 5'-phosphate oxidase-domain-containing protein [Hypoxylon sp. FL1284]|nr:pyridoxamine 5'-phosphate oxidase-domain-containing protein [Hypoxylon sp. FL1284]